VRTSANAICRRLHYGAAILRKNEQQETEKEGRKTVLTIISIGSQKGCNRVAETKYSLSSFIATKKKEETNNNKEAKNKPHTTPLGTLALSLPSFHAITTFCPQRQRRTASVIDLCYSISLTKTGRHEEEEQSSGKK
jgi:hypothetical protein